MPSSPRILAVCFLLALITQPGCLTLSSLVGKPRGPKLDTSLLEAQGYSIPPGGMPSGVEIPTDGGPRVVLEVRGTEDRHVESIRLPTDRAYFIEDLVQDAKLHERFGRLQISIMRPNGSGAPPVRLETTLTDAGKVADLGSNYALLPSDHILVYSDQRSALEKFLIKRF